MALRFQYEPEFRVFAIRMTRNTWQKKVELSPHTTKRVVEILFSRWKPNLISLRFSIYMTVCHRLMADAPDHSLLTQFVGRLHNCAKRKKDHRTHGYILNSDPLLVSEGWWRNDTLKQSEPHFKNGSHYFGTYLSLGNIYLMLEIKYIWYTMIRMRRLGTQRTVTHFNVGNNYSIEVA